MFKLFLTLFITSFLLQIPSIANAYVGPGAGLTAVGTVLSLVAAIILALVGFVWYPVKRLVRKFKSKSDKENQDR
jgi:flagellar biogenesis protein FliO